MVYPLLSQGGSQSSTLPTAGLDTNDDNNSNNHHVHINKAHVLLMGFNSSFLLCSGFMW